MTTDDVTNDVAQWLRVHMARLNVSQRQLAEGSGVSRQTISQLFNGKQVPGPKTLQRLAAELKVEPPQFRMKENTGEQTAPREDGPGAKSSSPDTRAAKADAVYHEFLGAVREGLEVPPEGHVFVTRLYALARGEFNTPTQQGLDEAVLRADADRRSAQANEQKRSA